MTRSVFLPTTLTLLAACLPVPDTSNPLAVDEDGDGATLLDGDCDDTDPLVYRGVASEAPDSCMRDADGDGYGDPRPMNAAVASGTDCDDTDPKAHPNAAHAEQPGTCMRDADGDGYGDSNPRSANVEPGADCDDADSVVHPNATEVCGLDANCDGRVDNPVPSRRFVDTDGDGYGARVADCREWPTASESGGDCDDDDPSRSPGIVEQYGDGVDNDCDESTLGELELYSRSVLRSGDVPASFCPDSGWENMQIEGVRCTFFTAGQLCPLSQAYVAVPDGADVRLVAQVYFKSGELRNSGGPVLDPYGQRITVADGGLVVIRPDSDVLFSLIDYRYYRDVIDTYTLAGRAARNGPDPDQWLTVDAEASARTGMWTVSVNGSSVTSTTGFYGELIAPVLDSASGYTGNYTISGGGVCVANLSIVALME